jgi:hypothetical protein
VTNNILSAFFVGKNRTAMSSWNIEPTSKDDLRLLSSSSSSATIKQKRTLYMGKCKKCNDRRLLYFNEKMSGNNNKDDDDDDDVALLQCRCKSRLIVIGRHYRSCSKEGSF